MSSLQSESEKVQETFQKAQDLRAKGKVAEAINLFRSILEVDDRDISAYHQIAQTYESQGDFGRAIEHYKKAIELDSDSPFWVYRHLGFALSQQDKLEEALEAYQKAIVLQPEDTATYSLLGQTQGKLGDLEGAISSYQKAVEMQPEQPFWLYLNLGDFLERTEKFEPAISAYQEASHLEPDNPGVYRLLGDVQRKHGDLEGAIESYRQAIAINPKQPAFLYENLADALLANHQKNEAIEAYRCAVEIQPDLPSTRQKLADILDRESYGEAPAKDTTSPPKPADTQHIPLYHQATEILNQNPQISKPSLSSLSLASLEMSPDRILKQVKSLKGKLNAEYKERLVDGFLHELATLQLSVENIEFQLKVITSKLLMPDRLLPGFSVGSTQSGTRLEIDAEFPLSSEGGFYPLEYDRSGIPFRWTGPGSFFYFDVFLDRKQTTQLTLKVINSILDENVDKIRCIIDNTEIALSHHRLENCFTFRGIVPVFQTSGVTRISFLIPTPIKASEVYPEGGDNRILGVAFSQLSLSPCNDLE